MDKILQLIGGLIQYKVLCIPTGAGCCPSTVLVCTKESCGVFRQNSQMVFCREFVPFRGTPRLNLGSMCLHELWQACGSGLAPLVWWNRPLSASNSESLATDSSSRTLSSRIILVAKKFRHFVASPRHLVWVSSQGKDHDLWGEMRSPMSLWGCIAYYVSLPRKDCSSYKILSPEAKGSLLA